MKRHHAQLQREIEAVSHAVVCVTVTGVVVLSVSYMTTPAPAAGSPGPLSPWMATAVGVFVFLVAAALTFAVRLKSIARRMGAAETQEGVATSDTDFPHPGTDALRAPLKKYLAGLGIVAILQLAGLMQLMNAFGRPGQDFVMWRVYTGALLGLVVLTYVFMIRLQRVVLSSRPVSAETLRARVRQLGGAMCLIGLAHVGLLALPVFGVDRELDFGVLNRQTGVLLGLLAFNGLLVCVGWRLHWLAGEMAE